MAEMSNAVVRSRRKKTVSDKLEGKTSKNDVNYRPAVDEAESMESCAECKFYANPGHGESDCIKVAGIVDARDVCDLFEQRTHEEGQQPGRFVQLHITIGE